MEYVISASELYQRAKEILNAGMDFVEISLCEPDDSVPDDPLPASVHFDAFRKSTPFEVIDFEDIDVVSDTTDI